jgi:hypothetical protein
VQKISSEIGDDPFDDASVAAGAALTAKRAIRWLARERISEVLSLACARSRLRVTSMGTLRVNKLDAARRQIDAAVRMTFASEDPVAIHSVAAAGNRILRDLCAKRDNVESYLRFTDWIVPEHAGKFWRQFNAPANFIKHAENDADGIFQLDEELSDFLILTGAKWYRDLGNLYSDEMIVFGWWWALQHSDALKPEVLSAFEGVNQAADVTSALRQMQGGTRATKLKIGEFALTRYKADPSLSRLR